jgi:hypothetical protein
VIGSTLSAAAVLTIDDGLVSVRQQTLVPIFAVWRYDQANVDRGAAWRTPGFDDSAWPTGAALFGFEDSSPYPYFAPITTPLLPPNAGGPITAYLRTRFDFTNTDGSVVLVSSNFVDDGAVWYLNDVEVGRLRITADPVRFTSLAQSPNREGLTNVIVFPTTSLRSGENVLAVEVHQSAANSSDVVFGMSLDAFITYTNRPVISDAHFNGDGSFEGTLTGLAGRNYAVEMATQLPGSWSVLTNFTAFTGEARFVDPGAVNGGSRFYRGRLVP